MIVILNMPWPSSQGGVVSHVKSDYEPTIIQHSPLTKFNSGMIIVLINSTKFARKRKYGLTLIWRIYDGQMPTDISPRLHIRKISLFKKKESWNFSPVLLPDDPPLPAIVSRLSPTACPACRRSFTSCLAWPESSSVKKVCAVPLFPQRPVRPMRCT